MVRLPRPRRFFLAPLAILAGLTATVVAAPASAQDLPPQPPPPGAPPPPAAAPDPPAPSGEPGDLRFRDANADRVILGSTAETHPKGTFFISDYEILLLQVGYAITDQLQVSVTGIPPIIQNQPYYFDFGAKLNLVRGDSFRAALTGGFEVVTTGGGSGSGGPYYGGRIGAIGQICFNANGTCRSSLSLNLGTILTSGVNEVLPVYGSAGFIVNVSRLVSLLAEPALLGALGTGAANIGSGAFFALDYGVRISGGNFGVDLTFLEPVAATTGGFSNPFILGYPFVVFTYRTDGDARPPQHAGNMSQRGF
jgi:hypothetical protein